MRNITYVQEVLTSFHIIQTIRKWKRLLTHGMHRNTWASNKHQGCGSERVRIRERKKNIFEFSLIYYKKKSGSWCF